MRKNILEFYKQTSLYTDLELYKNNGIIKNIKF